MAYCVKCKAQVNSKNEKLVHGARDRMVGQCPNCGSKTSRYVAKSSAPSGGSFRGRV